LALIVGINISLGGSSPLPARDRSFISHAASDIVGSAFFHLDYQVPMAELRTAFQSILAKSASWDGRVDALQVTDTTEHTIEVRAIMTAPNAPAAFDLRCEVRERLIAWLQDHHPEALPRLRTEVGSPAGAALKSGDHSRGLVVIGGGQRMLLISPAFADGEPIPPLYTCDVANVFWPSRLRRAVTAAGSWHSPFPVHPRRSRDGDPPARRRHDR
jgi:hypothetical protein